MSPLAPASGALRIFIGSGERSRVEHVTLIHSLRQRAGVPLDLYVLDGTLGVLERDGVPIGPLPAAARARPHGTATEFSLCRYAIPELCGFSGRAVYLDSDIVCRFDPGELKNLDLKEAALAAVPEAYPELGPGRWATSVLVFDCARARFDLDGILVQIESGAFSYTDFTTFAPRFLAHHPLRLVPLDPRWNRFDRDDDAKFVHFTELGTQPWRFRGHPCGELWFECFEDARRSGVLSDVEIEDAIARGFVRRDLLAGNQGRPDARKRLGDAARRAWIGARRAWRRHRARILRGGPR